MTSSDPSSTIAQLPLWFNQPYGYHLYLHGWALTATTVPVWWVMYDASFTGSIDASDLHEFERGTNQAGSEQRKWRPPSGDLRRDDNTALPTAMIVDGRRLFFVCFMIVGSGEGRRVVVHLLD